jgi:electron transport complex protein RnfG
MIRTLAGVHLVAGLLIVLAVQATSTRIQENRREALERAVFEVVPGAVTRVSFACEDDGLRRIATDERTGAYVVYAGYDADGELVGVALTAAAQGYADVIRVLYGYDPQRQIITGMTVLESKETPGLGDRIAKDPKFRANFQALDVQLNDNGDALLHPIKFVKPGNKKHPWQIDGISGATISSRAVAGMLDVSTRRYLVYLAAHKDQLTNDSD